MQLCSSLSILWHYLSLGLEWKLTFSSAVATAEFSKFANSFSILCIEYHVICISDSFISSFPIWVVFNSFSCLTDVTGTYNALLYRSGEVGILVLFQNLVEMILPFHYWVLCWGWVCCKYCYYFEIYSLCTHFYESFYHEWMLNFVRFFFCLYWNDHVVFFFPVDTVRVSHWLIWGCWTIFMTLKWIQLEHGVWSFLHIVGFDLLTFCWRYLKLYSSNICVVIFFFFSVFFWLWYHGDGDFMKWIWECSLLFRFLQ